MVWKLFWWSSLRKSYFICWVNSDMAKFGLFKDCFGQNWQFWEFLPITFKRRYESSYFLVWKLFTLCSLKKSNSACLKNSKMFKIWPFVPKFPPFWEFLASIFQKWLQISLPFFNFFEFLLFPGNQSYCVLLLVGTLICIHFGDEGHFY